MINRTGLFFWEFQSDNQLVQKIPARVHEPTGLPVEAAVEERAGAGEADEADQQNIAPKHSAAAHR